MIFSNFEALRRIFGWSGIKVVFAEGYNFEFDDVNSELLPNSLAKISLFCRGEVISGVYGVYWGSPFFIGNFWCGKKLVLCRTGDVEFFRFVFSEIEFTNVIDSIFE